MQYSFGSNGVVLKIIKHYQEEGQGSEVVQGVLLGLVVDDRLEITNCFPFPQHTEDDADFDEVNKGLSEERFATNHWKNAQSYSRTPLKHFLLAILLPHAKPLALCLAQVVGAARPPVWARAMLHIGPESGNSCHTDEHVDGQNAMTGGRAICSLTSAPADLDNMWGGKKVQQERACLNSLCTVRHKRIGKGAEISRNKWCLAATSLLCTVPLSSNFPSFSLSFSSPPSISSTSPSYSLVFLEKN
ncbi:hypothetical protein INR49_012814 [Caranx melampygus]|nr:hypothetical protein INR49_012814 [Caranx melampygus]